MSEPRGRDGRDLEDRIEKLEATVVHIAELLAKFMDAAAERDRLAEGSAAFRAHARAKELQAEAGKAGRAR